MFYLIWFNWSRAIFTILLNYGVTGEVKEGSKHFEYNPVSIIALPKITNMVPPF